MNTFYSDALWNKLDLVISRSYVGLIYIWTPVDFSFFSVQIVLLTYYNTYILLLHHKTIPLVKYCPMTISELCWWPSG